MPLAPRLAALTLLLAFPPSTMACSEAGPCAIGKTWDGTPTGAVSPDFAATGLAAYVATPPVDAPSADYAVLQVSDIFGMQLKNAQLYADALAAATGATVVLPDFFYKPGAGAWPAGQMDPSKFGPWLAAYPRDQVMADIQGKVIPAIKKRFNVATVKVVGFCWGGLYAALLAGGDAPAAATAVLLHPSLLSIGDVQAINSKSAVLFLTNGEDAQVPDALRAEIIETLKSKPASSLHHYPDARHGHTLRADPSADSADAFKRTVAWLKEH